MDNEQLIAEGRIARDAIGDTSLGRLIDRLTDALAAATAPSTHMPASSQPVVDNSTAPPAPADVAEVLELANREIAALESSGVNGAGNMIAVLRDTLARVAAERDEWKQEASKQEDEKLAALDEVDAAIARAEQDERERKSLEQHLGNILARIHGDGGHYMVRHGIEKACEDADAIICERLTERDTMRTDLDAARAELKNASKVLDAYIDLGAHPDTLEQLLGRIGCVLAPAPEVQS